MMSCHPVICATEREKPAVFMVTVPAAQPIAAISTKPAPSGAARKEAASGASRTAIPVMPSRRPARRRSPRRSCNRMALKSAHQTGMVKAMREARPAGIRLTPIPVPRYQSVTLQNEARSSAGHSRTGTPSCSPPSRASRSSAGPVSHTHIMRNVSTGISARTNFIAGQFIPQNKERPARRRSVDQEYARTSGADATAIPRGRARGRRRRAG